MENQEIIRIIENLKGRKNYEEKKASKLGFKSLYAYYEDKILKEKSAVEDKKKELEKLEIEEKLARKTGNTKKVVVAAKKYFLKLVYPYYKDLDVIFFLGSKKGFSIISQSIFELSIKVSNLEPILECLMSTIASAIFFFSLGEYTAEVIFPIFLPLLIIGQKIVFGPFNGSHLISNPI